MFPTLIHLGSFRIATYGVLVAAGYLLGILWLKSQRRNMKLSEDDFWVLIYSLFAGAVLGGKLLYVALEWDFYRAGPLDILRSFRQGFVFYGGLGGGVLAGILVTYYKRKSFLALADYFGVAIPLGHWLGRLGCLAAGCCYGRPTGLPWGVTFRRTDSLVQDEFLGVSLHPAQLYESLGSLVLAAVLYRALRRVQAGSLRPGAVFLLYVLGYAALRFAVEIVRADERGGMPWGLSPAQWTGLVSAAVALALLARRGLLMRASVR